MMRREGEELEGRKESAARGGLRLTGVRPPPHRADTYWDADGEGGHEERSAGAGAVGPSCGAAPPLTGEGSLGG